MKKTVSSVLAMVIMLISFVNCFSVFAKGKFDYKSLKDGTISITAYNGDNKNITIPSEIDGKKTSSISENAFSCNQSIKSVKINDGIVRLEKNAFNNCINLENVILPSTIEYIGENAFFTCTSLSDIEFPEGLETIEKGSFFGCNNFKNVILPSSLKSVGDYAFASCSSLESVKIFEGLTKLSNQMFAMCDNLKNVVLPESVEAIGRKTFLSDGSLVSVKLPKSLELIDENAFSGCYSLSLSEINGKEIREQAFSGVSFDSLILGNNVEIIESGAFSSGSYEKIYIPKTVTKLFSDSLVSESLSSINVDSENPAYKDIDGILFSKDENTLIRYPNAKKSSKYVIPASVKTIADGAFRSCSEISGIIIPDGVETIGDSCFEFCSQLENVTIPDSVTYLGESAFSSCSSLLSVTLSDNIEKLLTNTFSDCYELRTVKLGNNLKVIEDTVFSFCSSLETISIPKSVESFNSSTFCMCDSLSNIEFEEGSNLVLCDSAVMNAEKTKIFAYFGKEESYMVPDGVKAIGRLAIMADKLSNVTIPESVEEFGEYAVGYCVSYGDNPYESFLGFRIFGKEESKAQEYSKKSNIAFYTEEPKSNAEKISLKAGETFDFFVNGSVSRNTEFASSNTEIASVDQNGKITAEKNGSAEIFAVVGKEKFKLLVAVTGGENYLDAFSSYRTVNEKELESWSKNYYSYNNIESISVNEYYNSNIYTSNYYIPIMAYMVGGFYEELSKEGYGEDYGQFKQVGENLSEELTRMRLNENTVLFSGTDDISYITHSSSSITDMISSIGTAHTYEGVISTSIFHGVAASFGTGDTHTVLEIYADKDSSYGVYIADVSVHPDEYELLLNRNLKFEVVDAGIRTVTVNNRYSGEPEEVAERFIKLHIIGSEQEKGDESSFEIMLKAFKKMLRSVYSLFEIILRLIRQIIK